MNIFFSVLTIAIIFGMISILYMAIHPSSSTDNQRDIMALREYGGKVGIPREGLEFTPQDDMTPVESAKIAAMFTTVVCAGKEYRFEPYIEKNGLARHFTKSEEFK